MADRVDSEGGPIHPPDLGVASQRIAALHVVTVDANLLAALLRAVDLDPFCMPSTHRAARLLASRTIADSPATPDTTGGQQHG